MPVAINNRKFLINLLILSNPAQQCELKLRILLNRFWNNAVPEAGAPMGLAYTARNERRAGGRRSDGMDSLCCATGMEWVCDRKSREPFEVADRADAASAADRDCARRVSRSEVVRSEVVRTI